MGRGTDLCRPAERGPGGGQGRQWQGLSSTSATETSRWWSASEVRARPPLDLLNKFDPDTGLGVPGDYEAPLVPTAPGDYTFHLSGKIHDTVVDETATSSDSTFNSVVDATDIQFPDPASVAHRDHHAARPSRRPGHGCRVGRARRCRERAARHERDRCRHGGERRCHAGSRFRFDRAHRGRRARWAWGDPGRRRPLRGDAASLRQRGVTTRWAPLGGALRRASR